MDDTARGRLYRPIVSLIGKSEKAIEKLTPGTWQHAMLQNNLSALHIASALFANKPIRAKTRSQFKAAIDAIASMIDKTKKSKSQFAPGTSQHTLLRNRVAALRAAEKLIKAELSK